MADNVKLTATIDADSQPLQNELDKAQAKAQQTGKQVERAADGAAKGMDRAAQSARQMGTAGATAGVTIRDALRHPIQAIRQLAASARDGIRALTGMGNAAKSAGGAGAMDVQQLAGALLGVGSMAALITKAVQKLGEAIDYWVIDPIKRAHQEMLRLSQVRVDISRQGVGTFAKKIQGDMQAMREYYDLYKKAQGEGATEVDRHKERLARRNLEARGVAIDTDGGDVAGEIGRRLDNRQKAYINALEVQEQDARDALKDAEAALKNLHSLKTRAAYGLKGYAGMREYADRVEQAEKTIDQRKLEIYSLQGQIKQARGETPGADFLAGVAAEGTDQANGKLAKAQADLAEEYDKQTQALQAADEREKAAKDRLVAAEQKRADIEARQADASRREAMQHTKDILEHQMGRFGFQLSDYDEENLDESVKDRLQRRRNVKLDARIEAKRQRLAEGRKVHWTPAEQRRLAEYRDLRAQGKALTAEEKAMQAAKEQEQAAKELDAAATAIQDAASTLEELGKTKEDIQATLDNLDNLKERITQERDFAATVGTTTSVPDYGGILGDIKTALEEASKNIYVVK